MRIAIINWTRRRVGGTETYLQTVIPHLERNGNRLALWHEVDVPSARDTINLPEGSLSWCVSDLGAKEALRRLRSWRPDILYAHGLLDPALEAATLEIAPAVFFAHGYYGTCISGSKTFKSPVVTPCDRRFGLKCLVHYYPHRCGGWSPVTMFKEYRRQSARLDLLRKYKAVIVHSGHMRAEFENNGLDPTLLFDLLYYVGQVNYGGVGKQGMDRPENAAIINAAERQRSSNLATAARLLFLGRMEHLKGGAVFLDSLAQVRTSLNRPLNVTFAGDGPARQTWERQARRVEAINEEIQINFAGWKQGAELEAIYANTDLLVVPSLWPEPFGLVGPEAGLRGIPVAAFGVGGIEDWLEDGVNGYLAAGPRQTAAALAESIIKCLIDIDCYAHLRQGAIEMASRFRIENHLRALLPVLENVSRQNPIAS